MINGWTHRAFPIDDASRIGEARRFAAQAAHDLGLPELHAGRLALIVTELGTNLHRHALHGRLLIATRVSQRDIEVLAIDEGPGMPDLQRSMQDGQSTGGSPGTGLGAIRRLADDFDIHSAVPDGTVCVARVRLPASGPPAPTAAAAVIELGAIMLPAPGETVCGDNWAVSLDGPSVRLLVADGLGHGPDAAKASKAATALLGAAPGGDLRDLLQKVHTRLQTTRGAAVCALAFQGGDAQASYCGAGNIVGRVISGIFDKSIATQLGTAGLQMRRPEPASIELPAHALVILHSDGIATRWKPDRLLPVLRSDPSLVAAVLLRDHTRHRDDATVVVVRRND